MRSEAVAKAEARQAANAAMGIAVANGIQTVLDAPRQQAPALTGEARLQLKVAMANSALGMEMAAVPNGAELNRICKMPLIEPMSADEVQAYINENVLAEAMAKGWALFPLQCMAGMAYEQFSGLFAEIGVGHGKTIITLMIANKAYAKGLRRILLLVPSTVMNQLTTTDIKSARTKIPFNLPVHVVGGKDSSTRSLLTKSGKSGLYIMPYSYLSVKDTEQMLEDMHPELIICDEAHNLANRTSARTRRLLSYVDKHKPEGVALSGTVTSKSIRNYFHIIKWCLQENNPLPNGLALANEWAAVIDANATGTYGEGDSGAARGASGPLLPLIRWAQRSFRQEAFREDIPGFRKAFKLRKSTAPGVVSSSDASCASSIIIENTPVIDKETCEGWARLEELASKATDEWLTPNGDEIEHAIHCWKWLNELWGAGFYNELIWPTPEKYAKRKDISTDHAAEILAKSLLHYQSGQVFAKLSRKWLQDKSFKGCDTPFLLTHELSRYGATNVEQDVYDAWRDWKARDFEGRPDRDSHAIRVCPFKINAAVEWAKQAPGGIIWVVHQEAGLWCYDELVKAGIPALHCPAGDEHNRSITAIGSPEEGGKGDKVVVASIKAHGEGKNLQAFSRNYFLQWPRESTKAEQTIGRTHRKGQTADEVWITRNATVEFDDLNFAACLNDSLYIHQTANRQKLIYAVYTPDNPRLFPSAVLRERGLQPQMLSREQQAFLTDRFGG